ncbi:MAG: hypothetical protein LBQ22_02670 [Bacteroidales bacterium]|jgi:hypothetical protein|nr:hypothetical protein [Bacteroidales bacterium]
MKSFKPNIFIILLFVCFSGYSQKNEYKKYIHEYLEIFNENDTNIFDNKVKDYRMFMLGEYHFRKENAEIFMKVFTNLYQNANVRIIFMETSMAHGMILQNYLETGDEKSLDYITRASQFPKFHYEKLKHFYDKLPNDDKFHIIGVDLDNYDMNTNFVFIAELLFKDKKMPETLKSSLNTLAGITEINNKNIKPMVNKIFDDFQNNKKQYYSILSDDYIVYRDLIYRAKKSLNFEYYNYNRGQDSIPQTMRENYMYNNIVNNIKKYPDCNYFGQFGLAHIGLTHFLLIPEEKNIESFTTKLNTRETSPVKGKVCSTSILYYNTNVMSFNIENYKVISQLTQLMYKNSMKKNFPAKAYKLIRKNTEKNNIYILKLDNEDSPFIEIARKKFQYIIIDT